MKKVTYLLILTVFIGLTSCKSADTGNSNEKIENIQDCPSLPQGGEYLTVEDFNSYQKNKFLKYIDFYMSDVMVIQDKKIPGWETSSTDIQVIDGVVVENKKITRKNDVLVKGKKVPNVPFKFVKNEGGTLFFRVKKGHGVKEDVEIIADKSPNRKSFDVRGDSGCNKIYYFYDYNETIETVD